MKEKITQTLELEEFIENDFELKDGNLLKKPLINSSKKIDWKSFFKVKNFKKRNAKDFSSLERIRIVVEGIQGDHKIEEICLREGISRKTFSIWEKDFLDAFYSYSEDVLGQEKLKHSTKDLILKATDKKVYQFYKSFIDLNSSKNLVVTKNEKLSTYSQFCNIQNVIILKKVNDFRQINKHFEEVNTHLPDNGILMGCFETFTARAEKKPIYNVPYLKNIYFGFEFIFKRVFPKLPIFKKIYFSLTKGNDRLLSKAEALGRLVSCGFDILDFKEIDKIHYFAARKVKEPSYDMSPSYGPLFKMRRIGKNGKIIGVYKFRTMHPYSEYLQDYILNLNGYAETGKPANDFRLVPYAKFVRRIWLDEVPQLINVLKGEMKLVGCRPVSERFFKDIPKDIQELRLTQKPGCIPPYVALNKDGSVDSVLNAEKIYLHEKINNPYFTDIKYFFSALYNIIFKRKRSA